MVTGDGHTVEGDVEFTPLTTLATRSAILGEKAVGRPKCLEVTCLLPKAMTSGHGKRVALLHHSLAQVPKLL